MKLDPGVVGEAPDPPAPDRPCHEAVAALELGEVEDELAPRQVRQLLAENSQQVPCAVVEPPPESERDQLRTSFY